MTMQTLNLYSSCDQNEYDVLMENKRWVVSYSNPCRSQYFDGTCRLSLLEGSETLLVRNRSGYVLASYKNWSSLMLEDIPSLQFDKENNPNGSMVYGSGCPAMLVTT